MTPSETNYRQLDLSERAGAFGRLAGTGQPKSFRQPKQRSTLWRALLVLLLLGSAAQSVSAQLIISEFRLRGPNGANDEFIELFNNSGADHTVAGGGTGYAVAASNGVARCVIPNGTVIPNGGHYLCVNSVGYSLASYPAGNGTTATGDATYTSDIPDNAGIAMFRTSVAGNFTLANRMDAVGSTSEANTLYKEGAGYPALAVFSIDYSFYRKVPGTCTNAPNNCGLVSDSFPASGLTASSQDTNNNSADFVFVDTNGTSAGAGQRLGAPGPENLSSPRARGNAIGIALVDATKPANSPPNLERAGGAFCAPPNPVAPPCAPAQNSTFGTISARRRFTNNTGGPITRLRFRVVDQTTFPAVGGVADLRTRSSSAVVVASINDPATCAAKSPAEAPPCSVTVQGTTLETPPSQPNGSAYGSTQSAGTITLGTPLLSGASVSLQFLLGVQQMGAYRFGVVIEALPAGGGGFFLVEGTTESADVSISKTDSPDPVAAGTDLTYTITAANSASSNGEAKDVTVTDVVPANTTFVSLSAPAGWTTVTPPVGSAGAVTATAPALAVNASAVFTLVVRVNGDASHGSSVGGTASITTDNPDPDPTNNSDTERTAVTNVAPPPPPTPTPNRFANISTRLRVETGDNGLIGGFIVTGSMQKRIIVRGLGPSVQSIAPEEQLGNPVLELYRGSELLATNDNWQDAPNRQEIIDSTIPPTNDLESAILQNLELGAHTAIVSGVDGGTGVGLVEIYDLGNAQDSKLANIATRGRVETGDNLMIGGLILAGSSPQKVIVRAIGPSLDVEGKLLDPFLELYDGNGVLLQANDNWRSDQQSEIEATTIPPTNDAESAIVRDITPAPYTAIVSGVGETTGIAVVEVYALD